jgi:hypothetical protein
MGLPDPYGPPMGLVGRFGPVAKDLEVELMAVDLDRLDDLAQFAAKCRSLATFRECLLS